MNQLIIKNKNGRLVTNSIEVSSMSGRRHDNLLRDIDGYIEIIKKSTDLKIEVSNFFEESTYIDQTGRTLRCYDMTRKGCDMVANKMTGEKGVLFTAMYVTRFEEMERNLNVIQIPTELNMLGQLVEGFNQSFKAMVQMQTQVEAVGKKAEEANKKAEAVSAKNKDLENELNDVRKGLVNVDLPLRTQFNDAVRKYAKCHGIDWNEAYRKVYETLGKQNHINLNTRLKNRQKNGESIKMIDLIEEINLLVPAIRLAKTLAGVAV